MARSHLFFGLDSRSGRAGGAPFTGVAVFVHGSERESGNGSGQQGPAPAVQLRLRGAEIARWFENAGSAEKAQERVFLDETVPLQAVPGGGMDTLTFPVSFSIPVRFLCFRSALS
jgi:hypothetical protein